MREGVCAASLTRRARAETHRRHHARAARGTHVAAHALVGAVAHVGLRSAWSCRLACELACDAACELACDAAFSGALMATVACDAARSSRACSDARTAAVRHVARSLARLWRLGGRAAAGGRAGVAWAALRARCGAPLYAARPGPSGLPAADGRLTRVWGWLWPWQFKMMRHAVSLSAVPLAVTRVRLRLGLIQLRVSRPPLWAAGRPAACRAYTSGLGTRAFVCYAPRLTS